MLIPNLTFVIFTYNEQARIGRVIDNFKSIASILIVDNVSTDKTVDIAVANDCQILSNQNKGWVEDEETVEKICAVVRTEWIYWGFADEMLSADCLNALSDKIGSGKYDIISMMRKNYYYGKFCHKAFADRTNRVFKKSAIDFRGNTIHNFGKVVVSSDRICQLDENYFVHHFISNTAKTYLASIDRYTDIEAGEAGRTGGIFTMIAAPLRMFIKNFVLMQGYKGGLPVFFLVFQMVIYRWLAVMKLYEVNNKVSRSSIEAINDAVRDDLLRDFRR